jgi:hypothetical protein
LAEIINPILKKSNLLRKLLGDLGGGGGGGGGGTN